MPPIPRRDFWERLAYGSFWTAIGTALLGMIRLPKPGVMPEASSRVRLGFPQDFPPGTVRPFPERNVIVFSDGDGIYAISTVCTHLGCIVRREPDGKFECPCHGSHFDGQGRVIAGPAPAGLPWPSVYQAPSGLLFADITSSVPRGTRFEVG